MTHLIKTTDGLHDTLLSRPKSHDLGILVVHGIGEQKRGESLIQITDVMVNWLNRWLTDDRVRPRKLLDDNAVDEIAKVHTNFGSPHEPTRVPPYAEIKIQCSGKPQSWLVAESWWASNLLAPNSLDVLKWIFVVGPWNIASTVARLSRRSVLWSAVGYLISPVLIFLVMSLALIAKLLSFLPSAIVGDLPTRIQSMIAAVLGDAYVYSSRLTNRSEITRVVDEDIRWLLKNGCHKVVILAHSQGAFVALDTLSRYDHKNASLITYGSALSRLGELDELRLSHMARIGYQPILGSVLMIFCWAMWPTQIIPALAMLIVLSSTIMSYFGEPSDKTKTAPGFSRNQHIALTIKLFFRLVILAMIWMHVTLNPTLAFVILAAALLFVWPHAFLSIYRPHKTILPRLQNVSAGWEDFYASADIVPNGPVHKTVSVEVWNRESFLFDHVIYWKSIDDFIWQVMQLITIVSGSNDQVFRVGDEQFCRTYSLFRQRRTTALRRSRHLLLLIFLGAFIFMTDLSISSNLTGIELIGEAMKNTVQDYVELKASERFLGSGVIVLTGLCAYLSIFTHWIIWDAIVQTRFFRRIPMGNNIRIPFALLNWLLVLTIALSLMAGLVWFLGNQGCLLKWHFAPFTPQGKTVTCS